MQVTPAARPDRGERAVLAAAALRSLQDAVSGQASARAVGPVASPVGSIVQNAAALRVDDFSLRYVEEDPGALAGGADTWVAAVDATWAFRGFDPAPAHAEISVTFRQVEDRARIVSVGGQGRRTPLWLAGPVRVRRSPDTLVLVSGPTARLNRFDRLAVRVVDVVHRVLPDWEAGLVVEVPSSEADLVAALDAEPGEYDQIAAVTSTLDGSSRRSAPVHVLVNPDVFGTLQAPGDQVVMSHEATHVATGAASGSSSVPLWLVEGFADYVALRDVDLPLSVTAAQIAAQVRAEGVPGRLPTDVEFDTSTTHLGATYEAAWLACRLLARHGGDGSLVRLYRTVARGSRPATALRDVEGISVAELTRSWRRALRGLAG